MMKKLLISIPKFFFKIFKFLYKIIDVILITPLSKLVFLIKDALSNKGGRLDKFLNNPNTLIYVSLFLAVICFFVVDKNVINLTETEATVLTNQPIIADYNEEAFVVEGIPETADIVLMGNKSSLYLAEQLGDHKLSLDLSEYGKGTYTVKVKYNQPIKSLNYKLDPSSVTIVIYEKVSESRTLTTDVLNQDKLDSTLVISDVTLDKSEVIIKSYKEKLATVANVKALVDVNALNADKAGTYKLENVKLVAYDEKGTEINDIEIVPGSVTATVKVDSPSKTVPVTIVPSGEVASGSAIASITPNVATVTLYGEVGVLETIKDVKVKIDVTGLNSDKTYQETIIKPNGVRSMSATNVTVKVTMEKESSKEFKNIPITFENLDTTKYKVVAANQESTRVDVVVRGVESLLNKLDSNNIKAYVDLADFDEGTVKVPVVVTGDDVRLTYKSKTAMIEVIISKK